MGPEADVAAGGESEVVAGEVEGLNRGKTGREVEGSGAGIEGQLGDVGAVRAGENNIGVEGETLGVDGEISGNERGLSGS